MSYLLDGAKYLKISRNTSTKTSQYEIRFNTYHSLVLG